MNNVIEKDTTLCYNLPMTQDAFVKLSDIDRGLVGTKDYMGLAYFWGGSIKHTLRDFTPNQRKQCHDALFNAGLAEVCEVSGVQYIPTTPESEAIVVRFAKKFSK